MKGLARTSQSSSNLKPHHSWPWHYWVFLQMIASRDVQFLALWLISKPCSHWDLWSCSLSPQCVVPKTRRPDDRITFDTKTAIECPGQDTHPRTHVPCRATWILNWSRFRFGSPRSLIENRVEFPVNVPTISLWRRYWRRWGAGGSHSSASIFGCGDTAGMEGPQREPLARLEMKGRPNWGAVVAVNW